MNENEGFSMNPAYGHMGPMGIASTDDAAYIAWPDSRAGRPLVPVQDTYVAAVLHGPAKGSGSSGISAASMGLGVGIGLALAGVAPLALVFTGRARLPRREAA